MLRLSGGAGAMAVTAAFTQACTPSLPPGSGADANGVILPPGFTSRIIAEGGEDVAGTGFTYRIFPDGAATFADDAVAGGWYYATNHEVPLGEGGVTSIRFAPDGTIVDAFSVLDGSSSNCAGGATPWGTWLSGEEVEGGWIWECDPTGTNPARRREAMGAFVHEAAAVTADGRVYMTEDRPDGGFYRFTPDTPGDLSSGLLEIATGTAPGPVTWVEVPNPRPSFLQAQCRAQVATSIEFDGGEGIDTDDSGTLVFFATKGDDRVWQYDTASSIVSIRFQGGGTTILEGVDNLWFDDGSGALLVAEDGDDMQLVLLRPDDTAEQLVRLPGQEISEVTGPCFSPDGQRLYFSSQRGPAGPARTILGVTYEVTGPFDAYLGRS